MTTVVVVVLLVSSALLVLAVVLVARMLRRRPTSLQRYELCASLLTPAEKAFYRALMAAVSGVYFVAPKVRVADVFRPTSAADRQNAAAALNRISRRHFDFVLCDSRTFAFVAAIELDDSSRDNAHQRVRDAFINHAAATANLPLHRFKMQRTYTVAEIRHALARQLDVQSHADDSAAYVGSGAARTF